MRKKAIDTALSNCTQCQNSCLPFFPMGVSFAFQIYLQQYQIKVMGLSKSFKKKWSFSHKIASIFWKSTWDIAYHSERLDLTCNLGINTGSISSPKNEDIISRPAALHLRKVQELTMSSSSSCKRNKISSSTENIHIINTEIRVSLFSQMPLSFHYFLKHPCLIPSQQIISS